MINQQPQQQLQQPPQQPPAQEQEPPAREQEPPRQPQPQAYEQRPAQEQQPPQQRQTAGAGGAAAPAQATQQQQPPPPKPIRQLLDEYKQEIRSEPETEATKQFAKDIGDMSKEYDSLSAIVAKYRITYANFTDTKKPAARIQRDEAQSWCNDTEKIPENLQAAIRNLRSVYAEKGQTITKALETAKAGFNGVKSRLDKAKATESDALAVFGKTKSFENTANGWFADLTNLHKTAKSDLDVKNYRRVYASFLEIEDVWQRIRNLDEKLGDSVPRTPDWLLRKLNEDLRAVIAAKRERYLAHKEWLEKEKAAASAQADYKEFIEDSNERREFLRQAEDAEPVQPESSPANSDTGGAAGTSAGGTEEDRDSGASGKPNNLEPTAEGIPAAAGGSPSASAPAAERQPAASAV